MTKLVIYTDGGARHNPGPAASAAVIKDAAGNLREICGKYLGVTTNNIAEYTAFQIAYEKILSLPDIDPKDTELAFFADSNLAVNQLSGRFKIKNAGIASLIELIKIEERKFAQVNYQHVRREFNKEADAEVNRILDRETKN